MNNNSAMRSLVVRLARLSIAPNYADSFCYNAPQYNRLRLQSSSFHYYTALGCQPKLKINTAHNSAANENHSEKPKIPFPATSTAAKGATNSAFESSNPKSPTLETPSTASSSSPPSDSSSSSTPESTSKSPSPTPPPSPSQPPPNNPKPPPQKLSREAVRQNVRGYVFTRYFDYVKNYDKLLEKNFPGAFQLYRVFFDGVRDFFADMKRYLKIWRIANSSTDGLRALNRKELELFMQMPRDMVKVAPALIGTSLPMIGYAFFPLVFMYPRRFLTSHFWTLQQRVEFQQQQLQERFVHNRAVFRCLQAKLKSMSKHEHYCEFANILGLIGSGMHPTPESLLAIKDIFGKAPYSLQALSGKHIKNLVEMHGLPGGLSKRFRLTEHAFLVHHMDLAICREGGVHNMPLDAIQKSCAIRGLNPANLSKDDMIAWLRNWITISQAIQEEHISLFLHLPIFLAYNHPNNWKLIYESKDAGNLSQ